MPLRRVGRKHQPPTASGSGRRPDQQRPAAIATVAGPPRYALVAEWLIRSIRDGEFAVGSLLPTEAELCAQFAVSRHTVREALRRLREMDLVTAQQGIGTRVKAKRRPTRYIQSIDSISDLFAHYKDTELLVVAKTDVIAVGGKHDFLRCLPGQRWRILETVRSLKSDGTPIVLTEIFLPRMYADIEDGVADPQARVYQLIARRYGERVSDIRQEITACPIPAKQARFLKVPARSAGLSITRHYRGTSDKTLFVARSIYPGNAFSYVTNLRGAWTDEETPED